MLICEETLLDAQLLLHKKTCQIMLNGKEYPKYSESKWKYLCK